MRYIKRLLVNVPIAASIYSLKNNNISLPGSFHVTAKEDFLHLEQVQILFRHGARSSIKAKEDFDRFTNVDAVEWNYDKFSIPSSSIDFEYVIKSIHDGSVLEPVSHRLIHLGGFNGGELTNVGFEEAKDFGNWIFKEYISKHSFIPSVYSSNDIFIRSTISKRAVLTGVGVISGLYGKENLPETVLINSAPSNDDSICPNWYGCKKISKRVAYHWNDTSKCGLDTINKEMGLKEGAKPFNYVEIFDLITQRYHHGLDVPDFLLRKEKEIGRLAMDTLFCVLGKNDEELRNSIGSFVENICTNIDNAVDGTSKHKMYLYPSHDTTIMSFLTSLGIFDEEWPPFVANVIVELYRSDSGEHFVRLLHNRRPVVLDKETGSEFLPSNDFLRLVEKYRVKDWSKDCGNEE